MEETSIRQSTDTYLRRKYPFALPLIVLAVGFIIYIAIAFPLSSDLVEILFFILIVPTIAYIALVESRFRSELIRTFARENNYRPELRLPLPTDPFCLFTTGVRADNLTDCFTGSIHGIPFTFFLYQLQKKDGKGRATYSYHGIIVDLPKSLPHIIVDAKKTEGTLLTELYVKQNLVQLEGDFHKQFNVLVPPAVRPIAFRFLTPDFMHRLMQQDIVYDVEIIGKKMVIYHDSSVNTPLQLTELLESTHMVVAEILKKLSIIYHESDMPPVLLKSFIVKNLGTSSLADKIFIAFIILFLVGAFGFAYYQSMYLL